MLFCFSPALAADCNGCGQTIAVFKPAEPQMVEFLSSGQSIATCYYCPSDPRGAANGLHKCKCKEPSSEAGGGPRWCDYSYRLVGYEDRVYFDQDSMCKFKVDEDDHWVCYDVSCQEEGATFPVYED